MRISSVHSRVIEADATVVGATLDDLGSERDTLWPNDTWPTLTLAFDRPLQVGADGGHGRIRYAVSAYEPGARVRFTFSPGGGLAGTHEFRVRSIGVGRCVLEHRLDARAGRRLVPLVPILRGYHDAVVEDVLDRAERASTGRVVRPSKHPRWLRPVRAADIRLNHVLGRVGSLDRAARVSRVAVPVGLVSLSGVHAAWAAGLTWPAPTAQTLADIVVGDDHPMPPRWATWGVAAALAGAASVVVRAGVDASSTRTRALALGVAGVFTVRGVAFLPDDLAHGCDTTFRTLDLTVYSPLCLLLGLGTAAVARRHGPESAAQTVTNRATAAPDSTRQ